MRFRSTRGRSEADFVVTHSVTCAEIPLHSHNEYAVSYFFRGPCRCTIESRHGVEFHSGDVSLLNPGEAHQDFPSHDERDYVTVKMKKHFVRGLLNEAGYKPAVAPAFPTIKVDAGRELARVCDQMRTELRDEQFGRDVLLDGLVAEMTILLFRRFQPSVAEGDNPVGKGELRREIRKAVEYLHDNYTREFSLERMALAAGLSKYYLDRTFKKATGMRPHAYMVNLRVEEAKRLLSSTVKPAAEIALELGFSDQSHFSNVFKQFSGWTPQAFRMATNPRSQPRFEA